MHVEIQHHPDLNQFVGTADGKDSYLRYRSVDDGTLDLVSTFVHRELRGRGVGEKLVRSALDYARDQGLRIIPSCWFVDTVIARHPQYRDLLPSG